MLVLSRKADERILVANIIITVVQIRGDKVRLGIDAPDRVPIQRSELLEHPEVAAQFDAEVLERLARQLRLREVQLRAAITGGAR